MAEQKQVTEPAKPSADTVQEPVRKPSTRDPRKRVFVFNTETGVKNPNPVPETWLDTFPNLKEAPSSRKGA